MKIIPNSLVEQLVCPLTKKIPVEPVMAEDGKVYERNAIELYLKKRDQEVQYSFNNRSGSMTSTDSSNEEEVLSPSTQKTMGKHLIAAVEFSNTVEFLIEKGVLTGDLANQWKEKRVAKKRAVEVVRSLLFEQNVSPEDEKFARDWYSKDLKGVNVATVAALGAIILHASCDSLDEDKQRQNRIEGMSYILWAKKRGSILSAFVLGMGYAEGKHGLKTNTDKACYYLEKVASSEDEDEFYENYLPIAQAKLKELKRKNKGERRVRFLLPDDDSC